jgi:predicted dehydrogenase
MAKTNDSKLKVVVVGTGGIAKTHMKGWMKIADAQIVGACDTMPDRAASYAKECGAANVFTDFAKAVKCDADVVDVCTPNKFHTPVVLAALAAGKHVLCEKPLAIAPKEVEKIIAARDKAKKLVMTAQHMRFEGKSQALKKYVKDGCLGEVYYGRSWLLRRRMTPTWGVFANKELSGGGPGIDVGVHCLDLALYLMNNFEPVSVTGIAPCKLAKKPGIYNRWGDIDPKTYEVEDLAVGFIRFANGAALSLEASWMLNMPERDIFKISLFGDKAGAVYPELTIADEHNRAPVNITLTDAPEISGHEAEIKAFFEAVTNKLCSPVPPEESLQVIKILDGIYKSHQTGKEVKLN